MSCASCSLRTFSFKDPLEAHVCEVVTCVSRCMVITFRDICAPTLALSFEVESSPIAPTSHPLRPIWTFLTWSKKAVDLENPSFATHESQTLCVIFFLPSIVLIGRSMRYKNDRLKSCYPPLFLLIAYFLFQLPCLFFVDMACTTNEKPKQCSKSSKEPNPNPPNSNSKAKRTGRYED